MKLGIVFTIVQFLWTLSWTRLYIESVSNVSDMSLPDPYVVYYNETEDYPNQYFVK